MSNIQAFPRPHSDDGHGNGFVAEEGMTLRDYFAGQALAGMFASDSADSYLSPEQKASDAYEAADLMIERRDEPPGTTGLEWFSNAKAERDVAEEATDDATQMRSDILSDMLAIQKHKAENDQ